MSEEDALLTSSGAPVYARIPRALLRDSSVSRDARLLWATLEDHANKERDVPWPSQERLAEFMGCTPRAIRNWLKELVGSGWLVVEHRSGSSNLHRLIWKADTEPRNGGSTPKPRNGGSGGPRNSGSGGSGTAVPTKKNHEEEPVEEQTHSAPAQPQERLIPDPPSDVCGSDRVEKFCQFFHRTCGHQWDLDTEIRTNERRWQKNWYLPAKQLVRDYEGDARRRHLARITLFAFSGHEEAAWYRGKISTPKAFAAHVESLDNRYTALCNAGRDPLVGFQAGQPVMDADQAFAVCLAAHKEATRAGALFIKSLTEAGHPQRLIDSARATKQLFDSARTDDVAAAFRRSWAAWKPAATPEQAA